MRFLQVAMTTSLVSLVLIPGQGSAQTNCPAGVAANGACVNVAMANVAREMAIIYSQPNISQTAYPVLPFRDRQYRYPNSLVPNPQQSPIVVLVPPTDTTPGQVLVNGKVQFK